MLLLGLGTNQVSTNSGINPQVDKIRGVAQICIVVKTPCREKTHRNIYLCLSKQYIGGLRG